MNACFQALKTAVTNPSAIFSGILGIALVVCVVVLVPEHKTLVAIFSSSFFDFFERTVYIGSLFGTLFIRYTAYDQFIIVILAILTGINFAFRALRQNTPVSKNSRQRLGILGFLASLLGIGCVSCGSVFLSTLFGIGTALAFSVALPFHGAEFGIFGVALLAYSDCLLAKSVVTSKVCFVRQNKKNRHTV